eukprot:TRINITY_DN1884_c0_g1_i2.p1 TRINITY_DN1884_c0_g1~~TRINITY_DN1884_c0_g1_i2.p1  ORF type:complete len:4570 (+),score=1175.53 TRINITY_DN1884_c0_g1_i2:574-13710(+)
MLNLQHSKANQPEPAWATSLRQKLEQLEEAQTSAIGGIKEAILKELAGVGGGESVDALKNSISDIGNSGPSSVGSQLREISSHIDSMLESTTSCESASHPPLNRTRSNPILPDEAGLHESLCSDVASKLSSSPVADWVYNVRDDLAVLRSTSDRGFEVLKNHVLTYLSRIQPSPEHPIQNALLRDVKRGIADLYGNDDLHSQIDHLRNLVDNFLSEGDVSPTRSKTPREGGELSSILHELQRNISTLESRTVTPEQLESLKKELLNSLQSTQTKGVESIKTAISTLKAEGIKDQLEELESNVRGSSSSSSPSSSADSSTIDAPYAQQEDSDPKPVSDIQIGLISLNSDVDVDNNKYQSPDPQTAELADLNKLRQESKRDADAIQDDLPDQQNQLSEQPQESDDNDPLQQDLASLNHAQSEEEIQRAELKMLQQEQEREQAEDAALMNAEPKQGGDNDDDDDDEGIIKQDLTSLSTAQGEAATERIELHKLRQTSEKEEEADSEAIQQDLTSLTAAQVEAQSELTELEKLRQDAKQEGDEDESVIKQDLTSLSIAQGEAATERIELHKLRQESEKEEEADNKAIKGDLTSLNKALADEETERQALEKLRHDSTKEVTEEEETTDAPDTQQEASSSSEEVQYLNTDDIQTSQLHHNEEDDQQTTALQEDLTSLGKAMAEAEAEQCALNRLRQDSEKQDQETERAIQEDLISLSKVQSETHKELSELEILRNTDVNTSELEPIWAEKLRRDLTTQINNLKTNDVPLQEFENMKSEILSQLKNHSTEHSVPSWAEALRNEIGDQVHDLQQEVEKDLTALNEAQSEVVREKEELQKLQSETQQVSEPTASEHEPQWAIDLRTAMSMTAQQAEPEWASSLRRDLTTQINNLKTNDVPLQEFENMKSEILSQLKNHSTEHSVPSWAEALRNEIGDQVHDLQQEVENDLTALNEAQSEVVRETEELQKLQSEQLIEPTDYNNEPQWVTDLRNALLTSKSDAEPEWAKELRSDLSNKIDSLQRPTAGSAASFEVEFDKLKFELIDSIKGSTEKPEELEWVQSLSEEVCEDEPLWAADLRRDIEKMVSEVASQRTTNNQVAVPTGTQATDPSPQWVSQIVKQITSNLPASSTVAPDPDMIAAIRDLSLKVDNLYDNSNNTHITDKDLEQDLTSLAVAQGETEQEKAELQKLFSTTETGTVEEPHQPAEWKVMLGDVMSKLSNKTADEPEWATSLRDELSKKVPTTEAGQLVATVQEPLWSVSLKEQLSQAISNLGSGPASVEPKWASRLREEVTQKIESLKSTTQMDVEETSSLNSNIAALNLATLDCENQREELNRLQREDIDISNDEPPWAKRFRQEVLSLIPSDEIRRLREDVSIVTQGIEQLKSPRSQNGDPEPEWVASLREVLSEQRPHKNDIDQLRADVTSVARGLQELNMTPRAVVDEDHPDFEEDIAALKSANHEVELQKQELLMLKTYGSDSTLLDTTHRSFETTAPIQATGDDQTNPLILKDIASLTTPEATTDLPEWASSLNEKINKITETQNPPKWAISLQQDIDTKVSKLTSASKEPEWATTLRSQIADAVTRLPSNRSSDGSLGEFPEWGVSMVSAVSKNVNDDSLDTERFRQDSTHSSRSMQADQRDQPQWIFSLLNELTSRITEVPEPEWAISLKSEFQDTVKNSLSTKEPEWAKSLRHKIDNMNQTTTSSNEEPLWATSLRRELDQQMDNLRQSVSSPSHSSSGNTSKVTEPKWAMVLREGLDSENALLESEIKSANEAMTETQREHDQLLALTQEHQGQHVGGDYGIQPVTADYSEDIRSMLESKDLADEVRKDLLKLQQQQKQQQPPDNELKSYIVNLIEEQKEIKNLLHRSFEEDSSKHSVTRSGHGDESATDLEEAKVSFDVAEQERLQATKDLMILEQEMENTTNCEILTIALSIGVLIATAAVVQTTTSTTTTTTPGTVTESVPPSDHRDLLSKILKQQEDLQVALHDIQQQQKSIHSHISHPSRSDDELDSQAKDDMLALLQEVKCFTSTDASTNPTWPSLSSGQVPSITELLQAREHIVNTAIKLEEADPSGNDTIMLREVLKQQEEVLTIQNNNLLTDAGKKQLLTHELSLLEVLKRKLSPFADDSETTGDFNLSQIDEKKRSAIAKIISEGKDSNDAVRIVFNTELKECCKLILRSDGGISDELVLLAGCHAMLPKAIKRDISRIFNTQHQHYITNMNTDDENVPTIPLDLSNLDDVAQKDDDGVEHELFGELLSLVEAVRTSRDIATSNERTRLRISSHDTALQGMLVGSSCAIERGLLEYERNLSQLLNQSDLSPDCKTAVQSHYNLVLQCRDSKKLSQSSLKSSYLMRLHYFVFFFSELNKQYSTRSMDAIYSSLTALLPESNTNWVHPLRECLGSYYSSLHDRIIKAKEDISTWESAHDNSRTRQLFRNELVSIGELMYNCDESLRDDLISLRKTISQLSTSTTSEIKRSLPSLAATFDGLVDKVECSDVQSPKLVISALLATKKVIEAASETAVASGAKSNSQHISHLKKKEVERKINDLTTLEQHIKNGTEPGSHFIDGLPEDIRETYASIPGRKLQQILSCHLELPARGFQLLEVHRRVLDHHHHHHNPHKKHSAIAYARPLLPQSHESSLTASLNRIMHLCSLEAYKSADPSLQQPSSAKQFSTPQPTRFYHFKSKWNLEELEKKLTSLNKTIDIHTDSETYCLVEDALLLVKLAILRERISTVLGNSVEDLPDDVVQVLKDYSNCLMSALTSEPPRGLIPLSKEVAEREREVRKILISPDCPLNIRRLLEIHRAGLQGHLDRDEALLQQRQRVTSMLRDPVGLNESQVIGLEVYRYLLTLALKHHKEITSGPDTDHDDTTDYLADTIPILPTQSDSCQGDIRKYYNIIDDFLSEYRKMIQTPQGGGSSRTPPSLTAQRLKLVRPLDEISDGPDTWRECTRKVSFGTSNKGKAVRRSPPFAAAARLARAAEMALPASPTGSSVVDSPRGSLASSVGVDTAPVASRQGSSLQKGNDVVANLSHRSPRDRSPRMTSPKMSATAGTPRSVLKSPRSALKSDKRPAGLIIDISRKMSGSAMSGISPACSIESSSPPVASSRGASNSNNKFEKFMKVHERGLQELKSQISQLAESFNSSPRGSAMDSASVSRLAAVEEKISLTLSGLTGNRARANSNMTESHSSLASDRLKLQLAEQERTGAEYDLQHLIQDVGDGSPSQDLHQMVSLLAEQQQQLLKIATVQQSQLAEVHQGLIRAQTGMEPLARKPTTYTDTTSTASWPAPDQTAIRSRPPMGISSVYSLSPNTSPRGIIGQNSAVGTTSSSSLCEFPAPQYHSGNIYSVSSAIKSSRSDLSKDTIPVGKADSPKEKEDVDESESSSSWPTPPKVDEDVLGSNIEVIAPSASEVAIMNATLSNTSASEEWAAPHAHVSDVDHSDSEEVSVSKALKKTTSSSSSSSAWAAPPPVTLTGNFHNSSSSLEEICQLANASSDDECTEDKTASAPAAPFICMVSPPHDEAANQIKEQIADLKKVIIDNQSQSQSQSQPSQSHAQPPPPAAIEDQADNEEIIQVVSDLAEQQQRVAELLRRNQELPGELRGQLEDHQQELQRIVLTPSYTRTTTPDMRPAIQGTPATNNAVGDISQGGIFSLPSVDYTAPAHRSLPDSRRCTPIVSPVARSTAAADISAESLKLHQLENQSDEFTLPATRDGLLLDIQNDRNTTADAISSLVAAQTETDLQRLQLEILKSQTGDNPDPVTISTQLQELLQLIKDGHHHRHSEETTALRAQLQEQQQQIDKLLSLMSSLANAKLVENDNPDSDDGSLQLRQQLSQQQEQMSSLLEKLSSEQTRQPEPVPQQIEGSERDSSSTTPPNQKPESDEVASLRRQLSQQQEQINSLLGKLSSSPPPPQRAEEPTSAEKETSNSQKQSDEEVALLRQQLAQQQEQMNSLLEKLSSPQPQQAEEQTAPGDETSNSQKQNEEVTFLRQQLAQQQEQMNSLLEKLSSSPPQPQQAEEKAAPEIETSDSQKQKDEVAFLRQQLAQQQEQMNSLLSQQQDVKTIPQLDGSPIQRTDETVRELAQKQEQMNNLIEKLNAAQREQATISPSSDDSLQSENENLRKQLTQQQEQMNELLNLIASQKEDGSLDKIVDQQRQLSQRQESMNTLLKKLHGKLADDEPGTQEVPDTIETKEEDTTQNHNPDWVNSLKSDLLTQMQNFQSAEIDAIRDNVRVLQDDETLADQLKMLDHRLVNLEGEPTWAKRLREQMAQIVTSMHPKIASSTDPLNHSNTDSDDPKASVSDDNCNQSTPMNVTMPGIYGGTNQQKTASPTTASDSVMKQQSEVDELIAKGDEVLLAADTTEVCKPISTASHSVSDNVVETAI